MIFFIFFLFIFTVPAISEDNHVRCVWQTGFFQARNYNITWKDRSLSITTGSVNTIWLFLHIKSISVVYVTICFTVSIHSYVSHRTEVAVQNKFTFDGIFDLMYHTTIQITGHHFKSYTPKQWNDQLHVKF